MRPAAVLALTLACSSEPVTVDVEITTGQEAGAIAEEPSVVRLVIAAQGEDAQGPIALSAEAAPGDPFDLGEVPRDALLRFEVTGYDGSGTAVLRGRSLDVVVGSAEGTAIRVFAQRVGAFARPPGGLQRAHVGAPAGILDERYLLSTGGAAVDDGGSADATRGDFYDLFALDGAESPTLGRAAQSMVVRGRQALLIDEAGASVVDFSSGTIAPASPPSGLSSFAEVAGGRLVEAGDGSSYVVGGTRAGPETRGVLHVAADGSLAGYSTAIARAGAAATWVEGVGLVVSGGSADAPGVEILADGAVAFTGPDWPGDATSGGAAATAGSSTMLVFGGRDPSGAPAATRTFDLTCAAACEATSVDGADAPEVLELATAFALADGSTLVIGEALSTPPATRAYRVALAPVEVREVPLRETRRGAAVTPSPNGAIAILGGVREDGSPVYSVEMFFPP